MAVDSRQRVGEALAILREGLLSCVQRELKMRYKARWWVDGVEPALKDKERVDARRSGGTEKEWFRSLDTQKLLRVVWDQWNEVFREKLGQMGRTYVSELREVRNRWAHEEPFSLDDTYRAINTVTRFLQMVAPDYAEEAARLAREVLRLLSKEESKREVRHSVHPPDQLATSARVEPERDVATQHPEVISSGGQAMASAADVYAEILLPHFRHLEPSLHPWWWPKEGGRDLGDWGLTADRIAEAGCDAKAVFKSLSQGPKGASRPALDYSGFSGGIAARAEHDNSFVWVLSIRPSDEPFPNPAGGSATKLRDVLKGTGLFERAHMTNVIKFRGAGPSSLAEEGLAHELPGRKTVLEASLACLFKEYALLPPRVVLVAGKAAQDWLNRHHTANDLLNDLWAKMKPVPSWLASVDQVTIVSEWARAVGNP